MRVGLYLSLEHAKDDDLGARLQDLYEVVRTARQAGFELLLAGQHLLVPQYQYLQVLPILGRIAAESGDMEIGTDVLLLALHHPVHVAEMVATLDQVCGGRFTFSVGLGYRPEEYQALRIAKSERLGRMLESLELIKRLWKEDEVNFEGQYFQVHNATLAVKPMQKPRPPILIAATADKMIKRAATLADAWSAYGHGTFETLVRQTGLYRDMLAELGKPFPPERFRLSKELYVASTREQAEKEVFPFIAQKYDVYKDWGQDTVLPAGESFEGDIASLSSGRFIIGSPEDCVAGVTAHHEAIGFRDFCFRLHYPGMPHRQVMHSLDLFAERVLPSLKAL